MRYPLRSSKAALTAGFILLLPRLALFDPGGAKAAPGPPHRPPQTTGKSGSYPKVDAPSTLPTLIPYRVSGDGSDRKTSRWGYADAHRKLVIEPNYGEADPFIDGLAIVCRNDKWGMINPSGEEVIPIKYDNVSPFSGGLAEVETEQLLGFVDRTGKEVIPCRYTHVTGFSDGRALVTTEDEGGWRSIDRTGKEGPELKYRAVVNLSDGLAKAAWKGKWGFIDTAGKEVIAPRFDNAHDFAEGRARVEKAGRVGFIDRSGRLVVPFLYLVSSGEQYSDGLVAVRTQQGKELYLDRDGKVAIRSRYWLNSEFSEGLAAVQLKEKGKWGYINKSGRGIIPLKYDQANTFHHELAGVKLNGKWGFIDQAGKVIIPPKYDYVSDFSLGLATVKLRGKYGYVGRDGTEYFAPDDRAGIGNEVVKQVSRLKPFASNC